MIRQGIPTDLSGLQAIAQVDGSPRHASALADYLHESVTDVLVTTEPSTDAIIGYLVYRVLPDFVEILDVRIHPAHRRLGCALALIQHLISKAQSIEREALCLEVSTSNSPAQALYRQLGFATVGRRKSYYPDGSDALLMDLKFSP
ncbi:MAG: hypothetical protein CMH58_06220 [Myxococcales bacterium]|nr:hypothetical protein [Myxococcales bacterium]